MLLRRLGIGASVVAVGMTVAIGPGLPAGASSQGGLCSLTKNATKAEAKSSAAISSAIESGNWAVVQKDLLSSFGQATQAEQTAIAALSNAPSSVKAAGSVIIKFAATEKSIIQKSTSLTQFESSEEAAATSPKVASAEKTLAAYFTSKCGPVTSTPTT